jgi:UDP-glucose 4-epimerase
MSNILITGCAGLFGTHLSRHFTSKGYNVVGIDNLSGGYREYVDPKSFFHKMDLLESNNLNELFAMYKPDYVIHAAAMAAVCLSPFIRNFNYTNNIVAYTNLINCSINHNVKKFIQLSSMDIYGRSQTPFLETTQPSPEDPYGISKYAIELDLKSAHEQFGINYNIIRPHNVAGIYQNIWDRYRNVLGIWIRKCINREPITVYGDGSQVRAFSDIQYYLEPIQKLLFEDINQEIYNIGAEQQISILDAAKLMQSIAKDFGYNSDIVHLEGRNEVKEAFPSHEKAKRDLNFKDETDIEKMIRKMFEWSLKQPNRVVKYVPYELEKGLYSYWK